VRLACCDFGGSGPPVLFLHGLAGHSSEWSHSAGALMPRHRVVALDQRGHGRSERLPTDLSRGAFVRGMAHVIDELDLSPVVLVGQSMGGNTAFIAAAEHPELVDRLVVVEAGPDGPMRELAQQIRVWLAEWRVPFPSDALARVRCTRCSRRCGGQASS
jgi:pimeloyl-ACP methyl ester carboxylesterase